MSRLTDLLARYAAHHQPIDLRLVESIIRQEKLTGSLTIHYRHGQPKLLEAGKPIVVEVEPDSTHPADQNLTPARL
jgi:GAF domain-containing protein